MGVEENVVVVHQPPFGLGGLVAVVEVGEGKSPRKAANFTGREHPVFDEPDLV